MNTRWILNKIPHRPIKYLATISYLKISSWFARWSSGEDAFCKGTPHGIILQLVNSCPHPVSRTLCASSPSSSFLSFSRHDPNSFIFFLFPLVLRSPIFDRAKRREKKKGEEEYKRDRRDIHGYIYIYIYIVEEGHHRTRYQNGGQVHGGGRLGGHWAGGTRPNRLFTR